MRRATDDGALAALGEQLQGARRRAARLKRKAANDAKAWQLWSTAIEETQDLVSRIRRTPARSLQGVSVKLDAIIWLLTHDDGLLDAGAERQLRAFGKEVRALADR